MRALIAAIGTTLLAGCATNSVDESLLNKPGVELSRDSSGIAYIETVEINKPGYQLEKDDLPLCLVKNVSNPSVTLKGRSSTYVSPFTGIAYSDTETSDVAGGEVLQYVTEDGHEAVAQGVEKYAPSSIGMTLEKYLRYSLGVQVSANSTTYHFDKLEQALEDAGATSLMGFKKVGAWSSSDPVAAYSALESIADRIDRCLASR